jgi:hypothetical protein
MSGSPLRSENGAEPRLLLKRERRGLERPDQLAAALAHPAIERAVAIEPSDAGQQPHDGEVDGGLALDASEQPYHRALVA